MTTQTAAPIVHAVRIIGTNIVEYSAWTIGNRFEAHGYGNYSTIQNFNGRYHGRIGTQRLPAELEALAPGSPERIAAVAAFHQAQYAEAYAAIEAAFPETVNGRHSSGSIIVHQ